MEVIDDSAATRDHLLKVPQVAQELRISERSVFRLIANGELEALRIGKKSLRVTRDALRAYVARQPRTNDTGPTAA